MTQGVAERREQAGRPREVRAGRRPRVVPLLVLLVVLAAPLLRAQERGEVESPDERLRWFYGQRTFPADTLRQGYRLEAYREALLAARSQPRRASAALAWSNIGPAPGGQYSGRVPAIAVHPSDGNTVYIGAADGGVWKTTNGGADWFPLTDDQPSLASGSLAIDPLHPATIYYGTGEPYSSLDAYGGAGVLKSTDAGASWSVAGLTNEKRITRIAVNPVTTNILLAATWGGVYRSTDAGTTWTKTSTFSSAWDVAIDPANPSVCYAAASGVWKSTNGGTSWTQLSNGIPTSTGRLVLALAASAPATLYVLVSNTTFYKTTDAGASWTSLPIASDLFNAGYGSQGWYDIAIAVNPTNSDNVLIAGIDAYCSFTGGASWTKIQSSQHVDCHAFAFGPGVVYLGTDGGVNRSTDNGATFTRVNATLAITQFYALGTDRMTPGIVWGGAQDNGIQCTTGNPVWSLRVGGDGTTVNVDDRNSKIVYAELQNGYHLRTTNGTAGAFAAANTGITESGAWVTPVVLHPDSGGILYTATSKIYRSADTSRTWSKTASSYPWGAAQVRVLAIPPTAARTLYASPGASLYRSTDAGATWTSAGSGLPSRTITAIAPHRTNASILTLTVSGSGSGHVFRTTNAGASWSDISANFPSALPANAVVVDPGNDAAIYVGTDLGVWSTVDGGAHWLKDDGFPNSAVLMLGLTSDGDIVAATHGRSMFRAPLATSPFLAVTSPNGGETWSAGSVHPVTWTGAGVTNVRIDYSPDDGATWQPVAASLPAVPGSYSWTLPSGVTTHGRVRVADAADTSIADVSDAAFTIVSASTPSLTLTRPVGGEAWTAGSVQAVTWTALLVALVDLDYSTDNGSTWTAIAESLAAAPGSWNWSVPPTPTSLARLRIRDAAGGATPDTCDTPFSIAPATGMTLRKPNGGESWSAGAVDTIAWTASNVASVRIDYSTDNGITWVLVAASVPEAPERFLWTVPNTPTTHARVRVSDAANAVTNDISDAAFSIVTPAGVTVLSPNGGETWTAGTPRTITWTSSGLSNVRIKHSTNDGASWTTIVANTPAAAGSYPWTPTTLTTKGRVMVGNASGSVSDVSDGPFTVGTDTTPMLRLTAPNGGEVLVIGAVDTIRWASAGVASLNIEYSTNGGAAWSPVAAGVAAAAHAFPWTVPAPATAQGRIRITDAGNAARRDTSDGNFSVAVPPSIALLAPAGGELLVAGSPFVISWDAAGMENIRIEYSSDLGATWSLVEPAVAAAGGAYPWTVPATPTNAGLIRVSDAASFTPSDTNPSPFAVMAVPPLTPLLLADAGAGRDTLFFGDAAGASDGLDTLFGERALAPAPAPGTFDARFALIGTNGSALDVRDTLGPSAPPSVRTLELQPGPGGFPCTLAWGTLGTGVWTLRDAATHGDSLTLRMRSGGGAELPVSALLPLEIVHERGTVVPVAYAAGWNIVSLPVDVDRPLVTAVFPEALSAAFAFAGAGYVTTDTLVPGFGYWVKLAAGVDLVLGGADAPRESVAVAAGWNLVGAPPAPVLAAATGSLPPGIIASAFFGFDNGSYATADSLRPGRGYWVKVSQAGTLLLAPGTPALPAAAVAPRGDALGALAIVDGTGVTQTLRFGESSDPSASAGYELPVVPPPGVFDARFTTGRSAAFFGAGGGDDEAVVVLRSAAFPLRLRWTVRGAAAARYELRDVAGRLTPLVLDGTGEVRIDDPGVTTLLLRREAAPRR